MAKIVFDMDQVKASAKEALELLAVQAVANMQRNLLKGKYPARATGKLFDELRNAEVTIEGDEVILEFKMPFYWRWVEWGRPPGKMPPLEAIKDWLKIKGLPEEMAWPVAQMIKKQGTREHPFVRPYINNVMVSDLKVALKDAFK